MWQDLIDVLTKLCSAYDGLIKIGEKKRAALVTIDMDGLSRILDEEQIAAARIQALEKRRGSILNELSHSGKVKVKFGRAEEFYHSAPTPAIEKKLNALHQLLTVNVEQALELRDNNQILAQSALNAVNFHLNRMTNAAVDPTYGNNGANSITHQKKLDFKA